MEWKPVKRYEDLYEINVFGQVKSIETGKVLKLKNNGISYNFFKDKKYREEYLTDILLENFQIDEIKCNYPAIIRELEEFKDLPAEIWRQLLDFPNYMISNLGRLKMSPSSEGRRRRGIFKPGVGHYYYTTILTNKNGIRKTVTIHRLVALAFLPNPENKPEVNHKDGDKLNNNVENLEWCTRQENMDHAWKNGLRDNFSEKVRGENSTSSLTEEQVLEIRAMYVPGHGVIQGIADKFNVSKNCISGILNKRRWKYLLPEN